MQRRSEADALAAVTLDEVLRRLTPRQAEAMLLRAEGYTYREIGIELDISGASAWWRVARARETIETGGH